MIIPFFTWFMHTSANNLNNDFNKISDWVIQWKINFNPNRSKQAQEVISSRKLQNLNHGAIYFNHNIAQQVPSQKHLGMHLDTKLNFQEHLGNIMSIVHKTRGLSPKLQAVLLPPSLVTIYKAFIRPQLDYGDIIYEQGYIEWFHQKLEAV